MLKRIRGVLIVFLLVIAILPHVSASIVINEVMPNPIDGCSDCTEWVEIYNNGTPVNLTGFILDAGGKNITLKGFIEDFIIITEDKLIFLTIWHTNSSKILNDTTSLNNGGDAILLYNNSEPLENVTYPSFSSLENKTYTRISEDNWTICPNPTPGMPNNCPNPNQAPLANFTYSPQNPVASQTLTFNATQSYDSDGNITSYSWNFGDSATATGITAQHAYTTAGTFTINLTVTDSNNSKASITKTIGVVQNQSQQNQTNQTQQNAMLEITYAPTEAYFGSTINISVSVYKNDTLKTAIYLWIEDSEGERFSDDYYDKAAFYAENKFTNYIFNASLNIDNKCDLNSRESNYTIILKGLDEKINKSITLKEDTALCLPDFQYIITPVTTAKINETFSTRIKITNNKNTDTEFDVWSYVYRGNKCYSCTTDMENREENKQHITLNAKTPAEFLLDNTVNDAEPGNYSLKVGIQKEGKKIPDHNFKIILEAANIEVAEETARESNLNTQTLNTTSAATGKVIYESETEFNKMRAEIIFISTTILTAFYFLFRPKIIAMREHGV